ncbi:sulfatase [Prosthecobacter algae]|uniref:Sulfatase n=1 Tax=Prosthecobacter algae TaxID=1144682 RepID=A0ABP9P668_9BACT
MFRLFLSLLALVFTATAPAASRPNVLFILCDDLRPDALGCYGSKHVKTPNIDSLAAEGVLFQNAFCTTSLCSPSRASILSGLYAHTHGVTNNFTEYPSTMGSFPQVLQKAGYATAYIGKYHMGEDNDEPRPGYDWFVTHKGQGKYFDTEFNFHGQKREVVKGYYTTVVTDLTLDWLKKQNADKPWCMFLGHKAPHSFYTPEPKYEHTFDDVRVPYPATAFQLDDKPKWIKERLYTWHGIYGPLFEWRKKFPDDRPEAVKDFESMVHGYWGTILSVDDSLGRLRTHLEETGQLDNTLIVFMGDNGLLEGEHGMVDKRTAHEASLRIPIIARFPSLTKNAQKITQQVLTMDMAPSVLELCGAPALTNIHGKSWTKLVREGDATWRKSWFYHYNYEKQFPYTPNVRAIRTDEWKYIHYPHGNGKADRHLAELYNLKDDPGETRNLIGQPDLAGKVSELQAELAKLMAATGLTPAKDKMPLDEGVKSELPDAKIR